MSSSKGRSEVRILKDLGQNIIGHGTLKSAAGATSQLFSPIYKGYSNTAVIMRQGTDEERCGRKGIEESVARKKMKRKALFRL